MNESKLTELLERAGQQTNVGPPPLDAIRAGATRRRRRRSVAVSIVAAATVAAAVGGTALLTTPGTSPTEPPSPAAPAAMRLVGLGHAAIAVPRDWGTNQTHCGTPQKDTVILERDGLLCAMPRPLRVESVDLGRGRPRMFDFTADETVEIDGVRAERQRTTCTEGRGSFNVRTCSGAVLIPSLDVWFWAQSSTNAEEVDRILDRIQVVPDRVGVPSLRSLSMPSPDTSGETYADALTSVGLAPKIQTRKLPGHLPGDILAVSPAPGTMLTPGATVTVTIVAQP